MRCRLVFAVLAACLLALAPAFSADDSIFLSSDELVKLGANLGEFAPGAISNDETMMVAHQKSNHARDIAAGHIYKLFFIKFDWTARKATVDSMWLPLTSLEQYAWSADDKTLLCIGGFGTRFVAVDVPTRTVRTVFAHEAGKPGFRSTPTVFWLENGKLHTVGYFYDGDQMTTSEHVVSVDPSKEGVAAFEKVLDVGVLNRNTVGWSLEIWHATDQAYFGINEQRMKVTALYAFKGDPQALQLLDRGARIDMLAVGQNRVICAFRDLDKGGRLKLGRTVVHDVAANKAWRLGGTDKIYDYPYMSRDGSTVLVSTLDLANSKMSTWYAHDRDDWALHEMPGMIDVFPGVIRFSRKGGMLAFFNNKGLHLSHVP